MMMWVLLRLCSAPLSSFFFLLALFPHWIERKELGERKRVGEKEREREREATLYTHISLSVGFGKSKPNTVDFSLRTNQWAILLQ